MSKTKTYKDKDGVEIPSKYIHKLDIEKHHLALALAKKAQKINETLVAFKKELMEKCDELYERARTEAQLKVRDNSKGTYSITSIDKKVKIELRVTEFGGFGDGIHIAHELIKEFLMERTKNIDADIAAIATSAFETRGGNFDVKKVLDLKKYNIQHPKWVQAMKEIDKAYEVRNTKRYPRVWLMDDNGEYKIVNLDFASI